MTRTPARRLLALALATAIVAPAWAQQAVDPQAAFAVPAPAGPAPRVDPGAASFTAVACAVEVNIPAPRARNVRAPSSSR